MASLKQWVKAYFEQHPDETFEAACVSENPRVNWESDAEPESFHITSLQDFYANAEVCREFNSGYGSGNSPYFTIWTNKSVLFPGVYDGAEWLQAVPRNPCGIATPHVGGQ